MRRDASRGKGEKKKKWSFFSTLNDFRNVPIHAYFPQTNELTIYFRIHKNKKIQKLVLTKENVKASLHPLRLPARSMPSQKANRLPTVHFQWRGVS